jgi:integrase
VPTNHARRRANGEGSIYQYRGRWRAALTTIAPDGTRQRRVVSAPTQAAARQALERARGEAQLGLAAPNRGTVAEFLAGWLEASRHRVRPSTLRAYQQAVRLYITPALGNIRLDALAPTDVERMTARVIESGRSPRTAFTARSVLRRSMADAVRDGLAIRNAAALARPPRVPGRTLERGVDYLGSDQLRLLITKATEHTIGPLVTLAATTGLRLGELLGLRRSDIDLERATLTVRRSLARALEGFAFAEPKTARSRRTINLPLPAMAAVRAQIGLQDAMKTRAGDAWQDRDDLLFTTSVGTPLRPDNVNHAWHALLREIGLPQIPFHGLRHSAATAMLAQGVALHVVSDQLGHSTVALTHDTYSAVVPEQRREAAAAMERALAG